MLHRHRTKAALALLVVLILPCRGFFFSSDSENDDKPPPSGDDKQPHPVDDSRFCSINGTKLSPSDCMWPCSNVSTCPQGTEFVSFEQCELQPWQRAYEMVNVSSEDDGNSTASSEDILEDTVTACRSVCSEVIQIPQCCPGFFGSDCKRECIYHSLAFVWVTVLMIALRFSD